MRKIVLAAVVCAGAVLMARESRIFDVLRSTALIGRQAGGYYLLPTEQLLRPWGEQTLIAGRPVDMTYDSGKRLLAVLNTRSVLLLDGSTGARIADVRVGSTSYTGIAFRPGDRELWASSTTRNGPDHISVIELSETGMPGAVHEIALAGHPVPTGIAFSADGRTAYIAFSRNNSLGLFDAASRSLRREVPVGVAPFGVVVAAHTGKIFVSDRGGRRAGSGDTVAPSSGTEVVTDPVTGSSSTGILSVVDAETFAVKDIPVGLAPSNMAVSPDGKSLAVTNGHSDSVSVVSTGTLRHQEVKIPTWPEGTLGSQPVAAAFSPDGKRLYVACGGNNAVAVLEPSGKGWKVAGALPTGWFPTALALDREGGLRVLSIKGVGNTARGDGTFNSRVYEGSLLRVPAPAPAQVAAGTREVAAANRPRFEPAGGVANLTSLGIQHVFFIIKENRTYDQVLGDMGKGNGDPKLTMYGRDITPNHHALADQYVLLDNFYTGGAISFDGHQWLMQAFVSDYVERAFAASPRGYAWNMSDALVVPPTGFFWQAATRPLNVRIYGEFTVPARFDPETQSAKDINESQTRNWSDYWRMYHDGSWRTIGSRSGVPALQKYSSQQYPYNDTKIPDQIRAEQYLEELAQREKTGDLPNLNILTLTCDHTNGTNPRSPTPRAMVADDDLALGRIVEGISKSRFWPHSLILVVEDDAQDGLDHVDGHRTVALAIGPHIRRNAVDSNYYDHTSMVKTIQEIFQIPSRTRFAAGARAMTSIFAAQADLAPYHCLTPKVRLDEMNPPLRALGGRQLWAARQSLAMDWSEPDDVPRDTLNRILWWDAKGWNRPYPKLR